MTTPVIAIDGHAGAGKSTVADLVAESLGFWHVNTGLYYRAVTWLALKKNLLIEQQADIEKLAEDADIQVQEHHGKQDVFVNGQNISAEIRTPAINRAISQVSAYAGVRAAITQRLQKLEHPQGIIMDGRDIGTVVFPQAALKVFLTASVEERARRQFEEARSKGQDISLEELQSLIASRDQKDSEREIAPLRQAEDAIRVDSTSQTPESVVKTILKHWQSLYPTKLTTA